MHVSKASANVTPRYMTAALRIEIVVPNDASVGIQE
jgi:hypothetical protein